MEVARTAFARDGLELPMRELARRAGLGTATLYRHFPTREDIVHAALAEQVAACRPATTARLLDLLLDGLRHGTDSAPATGTA